MDDVERLGTGKALLVGLAAGITGLGVEVLISPDDLVISWILVVVVGLTVGIGLIHLLR
jgi:hypothetical protein